MRQDLTKKKEKRKLGLIEYTPEARGEINRKNQNSGQYTTAKVGRKYAESMLFSKKKISVNKVKESASHRICEQQVARITPDINHFYAYCIKTSKQIDDTECELRSKFEVGEK